MPSNLRLQAQHAIYQQDNQLATFIKDIKLLSLDDQEKRLKSLAPKLLQTIVQHPAYACHPKQIITTDARYIFMRCGRRFGKSEAGGNWMARKIMSGATKLGLCGETYTKVEQIMLPTIVKHFGGILNKGISWDYNGSSHVLTFRDYPELIVYCWSADTQNRGHGIEYLWCDEVGSWNDKIPDKVKNTYVTLNYTVSESLYPQTLTTTTPDSFPLFWEWESEIAAGNADYHLTTGNMMDNPFLSEHYKQGQLKIALADGDRGKQEYFGELIYESADALFKKAWIDDNRLCDPDNHSHDQQKDLRWFLLALRDGKYSAVKRIRILVDPAVTNGKTSDETGIVVLAQAFNNEIYIWHDKTGKYSPHEWAQLVRALFKHYVQHFPDTRIVCETNQGGDLVVSNLNSIDHDLTKHIDTIHASKGKLVRAETAAAKYQRGKVHHIGYFDKLERQMTNYTGDTKMGSPDAMDAMVHGINSLFVAPNFTVRDLSALEGY